jgi:CubicO group peptidase (beta-lactamase class C family)
MLETKDIRDALTLSPIFAAVPGRVIDGDRLLHTTQAAERIDAAGGIMSTLPDLLKLAQALFRGRLLSPGAQGFLEQAIQGIDEEPVGTRRIRALQGARMPFGVVLYKEGDGPGGTTELFAYLPASRSVFIGFTNSFGHFDEAGCECGLLIEEHLAGIDSCSRIGNMLSSLHADHREAHTPHLLGAPPGCGATSEVLVR